MECELRLNIDMTEEPIDCLLLTLHEGDEPSIHIHGINFPATIQLTSEQVFNLMVEIQSMFRKIALPIKERG